MDHELIIELEAAIAAAKPYSEGGEDFITDLHNMMVTGCYFKGAAVMFKQFMLWSTEEDSDKRDAMIDDMNEAMATLHQLSQETALKYLHLYGKREVH